MSNIFKEWKNMTPQEKKTEKIAIVTLILVVGIVFSLILLACCVL